MDATLLGHQAHFADLVDEKYLEDNFKSYIKIKGSLNMFFKNKTIYLICFLLGYFKHENFSALIDGSLNINLSVIGEVRSLIDGEKGSHKFIPSASAMTLYQKTLEEGTKLRLSSSISEVASTVMS